MKKRPLTLIVLLLLMGFNLFSQINVVINQTQLPVIIGKENNIVAEIEIENNAGEEHQLSEVFFSFRYNNKAFTPKAIRVLYLGTTSGLKSKTKSWALNDEFKRIGGSQQVYSSPNYSILKDETKKFPREFSLQPKQKLVKGKNYFIVTMEVDKFKDLTTTFNLDISGYKLNDEIKTLNKSESLDYRLGLGLRNHGDDGAYAYRIPGLVTTKKRTLLAVYDVRHRTSLDLQDDIDVGLSRSKDGGKSWEKMKIVMDMKEWGGLPQSQNGVGDPCILVDPKTNDIYVFALWTHGLGNNTAWTSSGKGLEPYETGQLIYVKSSDDGRTWSNPINITKQVKDPTWTLLLQGPGRGITMQDGTLVVPIQFIDSTKIPNAGIMYSKNRGETWKITKHAQTNTTEAQVVELVSGELMLNMRDNRGGSRSIFTTNNLGENWKEHTSSRKSLQEPVCMASLINVRKNENYLGKDILLFSNPNQPIRPNRSKMTIKASLDQGVTWEETNQLLLDEEWGWGYSCLTMIDKETVGILYEGSTSQLIFQAIKLKDIIKEK